MAEEIPRRGRLLTADQLHAMLRAGGVGLDEDDLLPRSESLGFLMALVEYVTLLDTDRLDHEGMQSGYVSMLMSVWRDGSDEERQRMLSFCWGRLMEDRLARMSHDLQVLMNPVDEGVYSPGPAVVSAVTAAESLMSVCNPPDDHDEQKSLDVIRAALEASRSRLMESLVQVDDGLRTVQAMTQK